jgi:hypothetical protein
VTGKSSVSLNVTNPDTTYHQLTYNFTATATSHELYFSTGGTLGGPGSYWDDILLVEHVPDEYSTTVDLTPAGGDITLDSGWAPYAQGSLVVPYTAYMAEVLDPREDIRVQITAARAVDGVDAESRDFDLGLRSREIDPGGATITLKLASDEALLQDWRLIDDAPDVSAYDYRTSLRSIINNSVLGRIAASLEATPSLDAGFEFVYNSENLIPNPKAGTNVTGWTWSIGGSGMTGVITRTTGVDANLPSGVTTRFTLTCSAAPVTGTYFDLRPTAGTVKVSAGTMYMTSGYARASIAGTVRIYVQWYDSTGTLISTDTGATVAITASGAFKRVTLGAMAPAGAATAVPIFRVTGSVVLNSFLQLSAAMVQASDYLENYYDGDTTDTSEAVFDWTGTANASTSKRTALVDRAADLLRLDPGESLYDFVSPLLTASGLRLYCDEARKWRLVDATYTLPGLVTVAEGYNAVTGLDTIDRDGDAWADGVIVKYTWRDSTGTEQIAYDVAGSGNKGELIEYARPFPGPGAAAYILSRMTGKGRVQDVEALSDYSATPSQEVAITLPDTLAQVGSLQAVTWDFASTLMRIQSRGLTDAPDSSWALDPEGVAWADVPAGTDWTEDV